MGKYLLLLILLLPVPCYAIDTKDIILEASWQALHYIDYRQTIEIAEHPDQFKERNPILGSHPSKGTVNTYFAITSALHLIAFYIIPDKYRDTMEIITLMGTSACVMNNYRIGVRF